MANKYKHNVVKSTSSDYRVVKIKTDNNFYGKLKTLLWATVVLSQVVLIILLYFNFISVLNWYLLLSFIMSLGCCVHVLSTERNPSSRAVWIFFLLLFFMFAWPIYIVSDENRIFKKYKRQYKEVIISNSLTKNKKFDINMSKAVSQETNYLNLAGDFGKYACDDMEYFPTGRLLYDDILEKLQTAKHFIFIEYFIFADGILMQRLLKILEQKVKEGVEVRIIYDDMGSHGGLKHRTKKRMKKAGIKLEGFNRLMPIFSVAINYRDHRKLVIIDGVIGYTGGANMADEYINEKRMHGYWKDCGIRIEGRCVDTFTLSFVRQWQYLTKEKLELDNYVEKAQEVQNKTGVVVPFVTGLEYNQNIGRDIYLNMIMNAQKSIYIMTPYFVPDDNILVALKNKAQAGVNVNIILPAIADKGYVYKVTLDNAEKLTKHGVQVYLMSDSFVHSKVLMTENSVICGSINFDMRSFFQQFESAVYTDNKQIMQSIKKDFDNTISISTLLVAKPKRLGEKAITDFLRIFSPLM